MGSRQFICKTWPRASSKNFLGFWIRHIKEGFQAVWGPTGNNLEAEEREQKMFQVEKERKRIQKSIKNPVGETKKSPGDYEVFEKCPKFQSNSLEHWN